MFKYDRAITLVTTSSDLNQNLALLDVGEYANAESLACIHDGYINVIPVFNPNLRCKYVPLSEKKRGEGLIKQIKWVRINHETIFVVASTDGLQIYDAEICDVKLFHACKLEGYYGSYVKGICVIQNSTLCVGTSSGTVWLLQLDDTNSNFLSIKSFNAHNEPITLLDGTGKFLVISTEKNMYVWSIKRDKQFQISRKINKKGFPSTPTALKVSNYMIFIGYDSGELRILDIQDESFLVQTVAHKLKITDIDFSVLKHYVLTASEDGYVKIWIFNESRLEGKCVFSIFNQTGPVCGVGFLNYNCTEFCAVTTTDTNINVYIKDEKLTC